MTVDITDIWNARRQLRGVTIRTPILQDALLNHLVDASVSFKAEPLQITGSFKVRGAYNRISQLNVEQRRHGVIASSAGNHGLGVAFSAVRCGVAATVVMPENAVEEKIQSIRAYGIHIVQYGMNSSEMFSCMENLAGQHGYEIIHPFDDPLIIAGQGTLGLELIEDVNDLDVVVCGVSGGGLLSGVATAIKSIQPNVQVIGVQPQGANAVFMSLQEGKPVMIDRPVSIADGLLARRPGDITFEIIRRLVDDVILVSEDAILRAVGLIARHLKIVCEPSGAVGLAAILENPKRFEGKKLGVILSGGNVSSAVMSQSLQASGVGV